MPKCEDLLAKARKNPKGLRFSELLGLAECNGWECARKKGSHRTYKKKGQVGILTFQEGRNGEAMSYQVRELLETIED